MRRHHSLCLPLFLLAFTFFGPQAYGSTEGTRLQTAPDGRLLDAWRLALDLGPDPYAAARLAVEQFAPLMSPGGGIGDLTLESERKSLTGTHVRFRQRIAGLEVVGGEVIVGLDPDGLVSRLHSRVASPRPGRRTTSRLPDLENRLAAQVPETAGLPIIRDEPVWLNVGGEAIPVRRVVIETAPFLRRAYYLDSTSGGLIDWEPLYWNAVTRVFESNPVTALNAPNLRDNDDAADAVPDEAYSLADLEGLPGSGPISGPNVSIVDVEAPTTTRVDLSGSLFFDRSQDEFEELMAYFHADRSLRYLQVLGFVDSRLILHRPLKIDAHAAGGADNSFYREKNGEGMLFFGDGGVDDAEDSDILLHELGHALHEGASPGAFGGSSGSEGRALGEAFGDYWAFSEGYEASKSSGRDPFCIGDWDARCGGAPSTNCSYPPESNCLRRIDGTKTMADFFTGNQQGIEHENGEIVSSALREIFLNIVAREGFPDGKQTADRIVVESLFGLPRSTTFTLLATRLLEVDGILETGSNQSIICEAMVSRGILDASVCSEGPRGEFVLFPTSDPVISVPIGTNLSATSTATVTRTGVVSDVKVRVDIRHSRRGDLRLTLTDPQGSEVILKTESDEDLANLDVTFGIDRQPVQTLAQLAGRPGNGIWTLTVTDRGNQGGGRIVSWDLILEFSGDEPIQIRPTAEPFSMHIAAAAHAAGAENTRFVTDVRVFNGSDSVRQIMVLFTPSGVDGYQDFSAFNVDVDPRHSVRLDDIVRRHFRTIGVGSLEFRGELDDVKILSRTYNDSSAGTFGQFIEAVGHEEAIGSGEILHIPQLQNTSVFRSNVGVNELSGAPGTVRVRFLDGSGNDVSDVELALPPFGHLQIPALGGPGGPIWQRLRAEVTVVAGDAKIIAYGSTADNVSGDPIYIPAVTTRESPPKSRRLPAIAHLKGLFETDWRSDVWITNLRNTPELATMIFHRDAGPAITFDLLIGAGEMLSIPDVVLTRFQTPSGLGQLEVRPGHLIVTSRTWTVGPAGGYGQFIPHIPDRDSVALNKPPTRVIGVTWSESFRTNVGVAEIDGRDTTVKIKILDEQGVEIASKTVTVGANGLIQLSLEQLGVTFLSSGVVEFSVEDGGGRVVTYASIVDNKSSDPIFVPARGMP